MMQDRKIIPSQSRFDRVTIRAYEKSRTPYSYQCTVDKIGSCKSQFSNFGISWGVSKFGGERIEILTDS